MKVKILSSALAGDLKQLVDDVVTVGDKQGIELVEVGAVEPTDKTEYDKAFKKYGSQRHHKIEDATVASLKGENINNTDVGNAYNINNDKSVNAYIPAGVPRDTQILIARLREAGLPTRRFLKVGEDKAAFEDKWQNKLYDVGDLLASPRWGVCGRDGLALLDADNETFERLLRAALLETFEVLTPTRKRSHFYIYVTDGKVPNKKLYLPNDTTNSSGELRAQNQYLVAPGTKISAGVYRIKADRPIAKMTFKEFEDAIRPFLLIEDATVASPLKPTKNAQPLVIEDLPCWTKLSEGTNIPVGTRHDAGFALARHLRDNGLSLEATLASMKVWHGRVPQPEGDVRSWHDIESAVKSAYLKKYRTGCATIQKNWPDFCTGPDCPVQTKKEKKEARENAPTDRDITDTILANHEFYCDATNVNLPLYTWDKVVWSDSASEGVIKREISELLKLEDDRAQMVGNRATEFIKGQSMSRKLIRKPPELIPLLNGLYNVKTGELLPHDSKYFYVNLIPHNFDEDAKCEKFLVFLNEVLKKEDIKFIQEWMGYTLFDKIIEAAFLFLIGSGQNAKSVFCDLLTNILGETNVSTISLFELTVDYFARSGIENKLAIISDDIGTDEIENASIIKRVSAGSRITIQQKYQQPHDIRPFCKPMFSCNQPPTLRDQTEATKMRLKAVEFPYTFSKTPNLEKGEKLARDRDVIMAELTVEISGIINWMLAGLKRLIDNKFKFSTSRSTDETWEFYRKRATPAVSYTEERWDFTDNENDLIERGHAYTDFVEWLDMEKLNVKVVRSKFYKDLRDAGLETPQIYGKDGARCFKGVKLKDAPSRANEAIKEDILKRLVFGPQTEEELENQLKTADPAKVKEAAEELFREEKIVKKPIEEGSKWGLMT